MWCRFWKQFIGVSLGLFGLIVLGLIVIDPYDTLAFSPAFERGLMAKNQRMVYPALARSQAFDSLIMGTSTIRMLKPEQMNALFDASFANLGMNDATAYEQVKLIELFQDHHRHMKHFVLGVDYVWCNETAKVRRLTHRPFPERFFDTNSWNDIFEMFNLIAIKIAFRQIQFKLGVRAVKYQKDGYGHMSFVVLPDQYTLKKARQNIYGQEEPKDLSGFHEYRPDDSVFGAERDKWAYGSLEMLFKTIKALPETTQLVLVFVPYHLYSQGETNSRQRVVFMECRERLMTQLQARKNTTILDFMISSPITRKDENYTDAIHYNLEIGRQLPILIKRGLNGEVAPNGEYMILLRQ